MTPIPNPSITRSQAIAPVMSDVEAAEKPRVEKMQKRMRSLASQNRVRGTMSPTGMINAPPYLPRTLRRGVFLQPRWTKPLRGGYSFGRLIDVAVRYSLLCL